MSLISYYIYLSSVSHRSELEANSLLLLKLVAAVIFWLGRSCE